MCFPVWVISAHHQTVKDLLLETSKAENNQDEYAYLIIDLENKLGRKPWSRGLSEVCALNYNQVTSLHK